MQRIVIIGVTGSGKTTLGCSLAKKFSIPTIDLDDIHWLPGWQTRDLAEQRRLVNNATNADGWVVSGNYSKLKDIYWQKADTIIWLDYPFMFVFCRLLKRSLVRIIDKRPICNGNYEFALKLVSRDSIMIWLFRSFNKRKKAGNDLFAQPDLYPDVKLIRLKNERETATWLQGV